MFRPKCVKCGDPTGGIKYYQCRACYQARYSKDDEYQRRLDAINTARKLEQVHQEQVSTRSA